MKLLNFVVCDDIRREQSNKHILIGVYSDELIIIDDRKLKTEKDELLLQLSFFLQVKIENENVLPEKFKFKFSVNDMPNINEIGAPINKVDKSKILAFALSFKPFRLPFDAKKISFVFELLDVENTLLHSFDLEPILVKFI